eukprot:scaffold167080_cov30-Tisochrysis_lutea.AAC.4
MVTHRSNSDPLHPGGYLPLPGSRRESLGRRATGRSRGCERSPCPPPCASGKRCGKRYDVRRTTFAVRPHASSLIVRSRIQVSSYRACLASCKACHFSLGGDFFVDFVPVFSRHVPDRLGVPQPQGPRELPVS